MRRRSCVHPIRQAAVLLLAELACACAAGGAFARTRIDLCLGFSFPAAADLRIAQPALGNDYRIRDVRFDSRSLRFPLYYSVRAEHFFRPMDRVGIAVELIHAKMFARLDEPRPIAGTIGGAEIRAVAPGSDHVQRFDISHGVNHVSLQAIARARTLRSDAFPDGRIRIHAGLGPGIVIAHPENRVGGVANRQRYEIASVRTLQLFAGASAILRKPVGALVEYKFTASDLEIDVAGGEARLAERTHHLLGGLTVEP